MADSKINSKQFTIESAVFDDRFAQQPLKNVNGCNEPSMNCSTTAPRMTSEAYTVTAVGAFFLDNVTMLHWQELDTLV